MKHEKKRPAGEATPAFLLLIAACVWCLFPAAANANVRVNQTAPGTDQHSTLVTLHPDPAGVGPDLLIVGYDNDVFGGAGIGTSWSPDQGATWFDSAVPVAPVFPLNLDASVASDRAGVVYAGFSSYDFLPGVGIPANSGVFVSASFDGGKTFGPPVGVSVMGGMPGMPWETKPKVDADGYYAQGSPYAGNAYLVWERDLPTPTWVNGPANVCFAASNTQGAAWYYPAVANVNDNPGTDLPLWPDLDVGSDGSVAVGWVDTHYWVQDQGRLMFDRTTDGGNTFGNDVPAVTFWCVPQMLNDAAGAQSRMAQSYASVAVDPSNPQRIGMAFAGDPDNGPAYEFRVDNGDVLSSSDVGMPNDLTGATNLGHTGTYEHACWVDTRTTPSDVFYNRWQSGVTGWNPTDIDLSTQPANEHFGAASAVLATSTHGVYVTWAESAPGPIDQPHYIYLNRSADEGVTWLPQAVALDSGHRPCGQPLVTVDVLDQVVVAWPMQRSPGVFDLYVNYSADGGLTWQSPEIRVPNTYTVGSYPGLCSRYDYVSGNHYVYLAWAEATAAGTGSIIRFSVSQDGGATWSAPQRLDAAPSGSELAYGPKICVEGGNVYVAWADQRSGGDDVMFNWSANDGASWFGETQVDLPANRDYRPQMACGQGNVWVVYESDRNYAGGNEDIYCNFSVGGGGNWQGERRVDTDPPTAGHSVYPRISIGGVDGAPVPYVVWMDSRNGPTSYSGWDAYSNFSADGGFTWGLDFRVDVGDQPGLNDTWHPQVDAWGAPVYLYRDLRNGPGDLYSNIYTIGPDEGDIYYTESTDGGATWLNPPLRVNDDPGQNDQSHPWLDIKPNGTVDVVWYDNRNDPLDRNTEEWFAALLPGATTFTPNQPVSNQPIAVPAGGYWLGDYTGVAVDTTMAHIVWADTRRELFLGDAFYAAVENPPVEETGACCLPDGSCQATTASACAAQGGNFKGAGVLCSPDPCNPTGIAEGDIVIGAALRANYPNPFNPSTRVAYDLAVASPVRLTVYDAAGRVVRKLVDGPQNAGRHVAQWDGRDDGGRTVAAGVYLCRLEAAGVTDVRRMVLLK